MTPPSAARLRSLFSRFLSTAPTNQRLLRFLSTTPLYSDSSISPSPTNRTPNFFDDPDDSSGSAAYNHALRYSRPHTIKLRDHLYHLCNSAAFIGTVERTPTPYNRRNACRLGAYTVLSVKSSPVSHTLFRVFVEMWDEMAKVALEHVKPGDYVYVAGQLGSYQKADSCGNDRLHYKVVVKELNYVKQHKENQALDEPQQSNSQDGSSSRRHKERLHLWQIFFSNAQEWHDWRTNKKTPRSPDFKHKSTGEALWLKADDPPWIKTQLDIHDSMVAAGCFNDSSSRRSVSSYVSDHL